jgi:hypothetical protein
MPELTDLHVTVHGSYKPAYYYSVSWTCKGARYHYWAADGDLNPRPDRPTSDKVTLYKNPLLGVLRDAPEHFRTRHLDARAKENAAMIAAAQMEALQRNLLAEALAAIAEKDKAKELEWREAVRQKQIGERSAKVFEYLRKLSGLDGPPTVADYEETRRLIRDIEDGTADIIKRYEAQHAA